MIDHDLHSWLNIATALILAGAITYGSLLPYMTRDKR